MRFFLLIMLGGFVLHAMEYKLSNQNIANGKTLFIEFSKEVDEEILKVVMDKKEYGVFASHDTNHSMYALIPINYYETPKQKSLTLFYKQGDALKTEEIRISVVDGMYEKEQLKVSQNKVTPNKQESERASREYAQAMQIYGHVTPTSYLDRAFILPMQSAITSDFGRARVYNGSLKGFHSGTDFRANVGTPIIASNDGVVALVAERFYSGGTVILDHGHGIYTCYFHMSQFDVQESDRVHRGDTLGLSGASGRVTGPHLHFAVRIDGQQVDPLQFIALINQKLFKENK